MTTDVNLVDVCLVSANDISREGFAHILEKEGFNVLKSAECIDELDREASSEDFLTILDCPAPNLQCDAVEEAKEKLPSSKVVVLSEHFDLKTVIDCFNSGAQGYIIKSMKSTRMIAALKLAALGEKVVPTDFVDMIGGRGVECATSANVEQEIEDAKLSPRELDVLCCLMAGFPNKVIARQLDVCEATVKVHVKAILRKLNVRNRTQAALWANSRGIHEAAMVS